MKTPLHKGRNLSTAQKYENAIWALHPEGKELKTNAARRAEEISKRYAEWSEANPDHSREAGQIAYATIVNATKSNKEISNAGPIS